MVAAVNCPSIFDRTAGASAGRCYTSSGELHPPPPLCGDEAHQSSETEPLSEDGDAEPVVARLFCYEEIHRAILAALQQPRRSSSSSKKRKRHRPPPPPSGYSGDDDDVEQSPPRVPVPRSQRRPATRARRGKNVTKKARSPGYWNKKVARRILYRDFRAPSPSRGRTKLRCQCVEIAAAAGGDDRPSECALHQGTPVSMEEEEGWVREVRRRVPLAAGPGEVRVPRRSARDSLAAVAQYANWRRAVWMPTRFYLERGLDPRRPLWAE